MLWEVAIESKPERRLQINKQYVSLTLILFIGNKYERKRILIRIKFYSLVKHHFTYIKKVNSAIVEKTRVLNNKTKDLQQETDIFSDHLNKEKDKERAKPFNTYRMPMYNGNVFSNKYISQ